MKTTHITCLLAATTLTLAHADRVNVAEDDASASSYNDGWNSDQNGGTGFRGWIHRSNSGDGEAGESHAGFFIGNVSDHPDLDNAAMRDKVFGMFANGVDYEAAVAFRTFDEPLQVGDAFSLMMESDEIVPKFDTDISDPGQVGFALRAGTASGEWSEFESDARLRFVIEEGNGNYQIHDGEDDPDSGVLVTPQGVAVTVLLVTPDTYDLEITDLGTGETTELAGRKLAGDADGALQSFAVFDIDGERADTYFNGFQVSRSAESIGR
jgi:hypothetical protein